MKTLSGARAHVVLAPVLEHPFQWPRPLLGTAASSARPPDQPGVNAFAAIQLPVLVLLLSRACQLDLVCSTYSILNSYSGQTATFALHPCLHGCGRLCQTDSYSSQSSSTVYVPAVPVLSGALTTQAKLPIPTPTPHPCPRIRELGACL